MTPVLARITEHTTATERGHHIVLLHKFQRFVFDQTIAQIARQLTQLDGLCLDNAPERRNVAAWIAANFTPRG